MKHSAKTRQFEELKSLDLQRCESVGDIVDAMRYCAFGARMLGEVAKTICEMAIGSRQAAADLRRSGEYTAGTAAQEVRQEPLVPADRDAGGLRQDARLAAAMSSSSARSPSAMPRRSTRSPSARDLYQSLRHGAARPGARRVFPRRRVRRSALHHAGDLRRPRRMVERQAQLDQFASSPAWLPMAAWQRRWRAAQKLLKR